MMRIVARTSSVAAVTAAAAATARPAAAAVVSASSSSSSLRPHAPRPCIRCFASAPPRPPLPPTSRRDPFLNQPRGPRILPLGAAGDARNQSGQDPSAGGSGGAGGGGDRAAKFKVLFGAVGLITLATVLSGLQEWWARRQATEAELLEASVDARAELAYRGFPLELLTALRAAKEVARRGEQEAVAAESRCAEEMERLHPASAHRHARVTPGTDVFVDPTPDAAKQQSKALSTDAPARLLLARQTPSLVEAERLLRLVLAQHLAFVGIDLKRVAELAETAAAAPSSAAAAKEQQQRRKGESAAAAAERVAQAREAAQRELEQLMTGQGAGGSPSVHESAGIKVDRAVLPYVLSLLAHNLQLQARVIQQRANVETANAAATPVATADAAASASPAPSAPSVPLPQSLSSAAARKYRDSEQAYLQSLALYRHHLSQDPRPLAVGVLRGLGGLYLDAGRADRAEAVWVRAMEMLAGSRRSLESWQATAASSQAPPVRADVPTFLNRDSTRIQDPAWLQAHSRMSSELAAALGELHRSRGQYAKSIGWTQEALREWDRFWTERTNVDAAATAAATAADASDPTATQMHVEAAATNPTVTTRGSGKVTGQSTAPLSQEQRNQLIALDSLPRAMHLLSALAHDLHESAGAAGSGARSNGSASSSADALATGVQSLQALERIVALSAHVRHDSEAIAAAAAMEASVASSSQAQSQAPYAPFLDPAFVGQLHRMLAAMESPPPPPPKPSAAAAARAAAAAAATVSATEPEVRAEACAAYSNLAMMLAAAGASKEADATAAREIAGHVCPRRAAADA